MHAATMRFAIATVCVTLAACATPPQNTLAPVAVVLCAQEGAARYRVNGRDVPVDAVVAAIMSAGGADGARVALFADPAVRYGDVSDLLLRLRVAGLNEAGVERLAIDAGACRSWR
jgi:hypothetical protein